MVAVKPVYLLAGAVVAGAALWAYLPKPKTAGTALGGAAVDAVDGLMSGAILGLGERVGVPPTDMDECERAIREGRTWDASFACPAGRFLRYVATGE